MFTQAYTTAQQALSQLEQLENEVERYKTQYKAIEERLKTHHKHTVWLRERVTDPPTKPIICILKPSRLLQDGCQPMLLLHAKVLERLPAGWSLLMRVRMVEDAATPSMVSSQRFTLPLLRPGEVWQQYVSISLPWIWSSIQVDISLEQVFISGAAVSLPLLSCHINLLSFASDVAYTTQEDPFYQIMTSHEDILPTFHHLTISTAMGESDRSSTIDETPQLVTVPLHELTTRSNAYISMTNESPITMDQMYTMMLAFLLGEHKSEQDLGCLLKHDSFAEFYLPGMTHPIQLILMRGIQASHQAYIQVIAPSHHTQQIVMNALKQRITSLLT